VRQEWDRAISLYDRILQIDPAAAGCHYRRALANYHQRRYAIAFRDNRAALAMSGLLPDDRIEALLLQANLLMANGEVDESIEAGFRGRWLRDFGTDPNSDPPQFGPGLVETRIETLRDLAELAIIHRSDVGIAAELHRQVDALQERYAEWLGSPNRDVLYLNEDWTRNIGHIALLDYLLKMRDLGWTKWKEIVLLASPKRTANAAFLACFRNRLRIVASDSVPAGPRHFATAFGFRVSSPLPLPDGTSPWLTAGLGIVQEEWERQGRGPQLALSAEDEAFGRDQLRAMGVPPDAWFVGLHVRSSSFYGERDSSPQSHRNARIESYVPAIEEIVRRGGRVFRMGDRNMPPLPPTPGAIDYARSRFKSDRMDVFFCARSRFFIGVASGLGNVPAVFGVPCLMTNWLSNSLPFYSRDDMFLPKLLYRKADGTRLTFNEWLSPPVWNASYSVEGLDALGLSAIDNTPEELREAAAAMLDHLGGKSRHTPETLSRENTFAETARSQGLRGFARVVPAFLTRHRELLPLRHEGHTAVDIARTGV
jgi:putative glycosyltransferase (TIGR04372 family)